jgi:hypothetical protein
MNSIFFIRKLSLLVVFSVSSLLYTSCNQADSQDMENYQLLEQKISQLEKRIIALEEKIGATEVPVEDAQNPNQQLYRDETLDISFPKPEGVHIQASDSTLTIWTEADYERIEEFVEVTPLSITMDNNPNNLTAQEWLSTRNYNLEGTVEEQMVGNQQGIRFDWAGMWGYTSVAVPHPTGQKIIIITWDNGMSEYEGFFEDIVAGLVFI